MALTKLFSCRVRMPSRSAGARWRRPVPILCLAALFRLEAETTPHNIILLIGDGMGVSHLTAGHVAKGRLELNRFKTLGLVTTWSANALVTDSAAAATALATGHKTTNGALAWSPRGTPLPTLFERAEQQGKSTGVAVLCTVTHATPAAFIAHINSRSKQAEIAEQIARSQIDVLIGSGWAYFVPQKTPGSKRTDDHDLLALLAQRMKVVRSLEGLRQSGGEPRLAAFLAPVQPPGRSEREYSLAELTQTAIRILDRDPDGFILMVEGSQIDWFSHDNKGRDVIDEVLDFDEAVGAALDFAQTTGDTLVVVTADHETGGLAVHKGSVQYQAVTQTAFTSKSHTAAMVPLFAYGPGSPRFAGIQDIADVGRHLLRLLQNRN